MSTSDVARPRICFMVLTHAAPAHLARLVEALGEEGDAVVVHVDGKVDEAPFRRAAPDAHFVAERVRVRWAGFSTVQAMLNLLRTSRREVPDADHYWLVSGDAYPLRSVAGLRAHLAAHPGAEYLSLVPMPSVEMEKPLSRISHPYLEHDPRKHPWLHRLVLAVHLRLPRPYKRALGGLQPWCGSPWFTFTADAVDHVLRETDARPEYVRLMRRSFCVDEHYFQTLIGSSSFLSRCRPSLQYHDFRPDGDLPRPAQIAPRHVDELAAFVDHPPVDAYGEREYLFARKFNDGAPEVVDLVRDRLWGLSVGS
ncbi:beta-1,6-N-acetylglucosaminyltransferase [Solicola sp. PLA-1-18]|uniref:beta-1,6-N-acetylglucosaminyltransferase n=1 Tax=Solicola sp. PLA-1-18 TaxID=3380532 RepID=UPI003B76FF8B